MANEPEEPRPEAVDEEEEGGPIKSFLEHLEDLRWVIIKVVASLGIAMAICLAGAPFIIAILQNPLKASGTGIKIQWLGPVGGMVATMKIALYGGLVFSLPFILYFIAEYVLPALKKKERKYFVRAFTIGTGLFLAGVALCYFVMLKICITGIAAFNTWLGVETDYWRAEEYFQFVIMFMVGMGVSFEIPVVVLTLVRIGIIPHEWMVKGRKYFFVGNLVVCSFITPDFISTFFMVIPVQVLMEICILISAYWERQKRVAEAAAAAREASPAAPVD